MQPALAEKIVSTGIAARLVAALALHPVRAIPVAFFFIALVGGAALSLPISSESGEWTSFIDALFTAVSALCVTGLAVVDTESHWSATGETIILLLIQFGGFGLMAAAALLLSFWGDSSSLAFRRRTAAENATINPGNMKNALKLIVAITIMTETLLFLALASRFHWGYGQDGATAAWNGLFHAISTFNNAGFARWPDSVVGFNQDIFILGPIMVGIVIGALGFPVYSDWYHRKEGQGWSLHSKLTLVGTVVLLLGGWLLFTIFEWHNSKTLGDMPMGAKLLNAAFQSVTTRTAGYNAIDIAGLSDASLLLTCVLMFIGGGSAGTAGGIKITTVMVLLLIVAAEVRGNRDVNFGKRRISGALQRRATAVLFLAASLIALVALIIQSTSGLPMRDVVFEAVSAFATVGLSTGITASLPPVGKLLIILLMFLGRVGPITFVTALAMRRGTQGYRYPKEEVSIG